MKISSTDLGKSGLAFCPSEFPPQSFEEALFHIIPAPLETSVSYGGGTKNGPDAILRASDELEPIYLGREPGKYGVHVKDEITYDSNKGVEDFLFKLEVSVAETLRQGKIPVTLGGEHTISLGAYRGVKVAYPDEKVGIIQVDAHADLRDEYDGDAMSHACVMRRIHHQFNSPLLQLGVRGISHEERDYRNDHAEEISFQDANAIWKNGFAESILPDNFPKKIYLTFDVDGLDASLMPATGTPSPGGLFWHQIEQLFELIHQSGRELVGIDIVELAPIADFNSADFTAAVATYAAMDLATRNRD